MQQVNPTPAFRGFAVWHPVTSLSALSTQHSENLLLVTHTKGIGRAQPRTGTINHQAHPFANAHLPAAQRNGLAAAAPQQQQQQWRRPRRRLQQQQTRTRRRAWRRWWTRRWWRQRQLPDEPRVVLVQGRGLQRPGGREHRRGGRGHQRLPRAHAAGLQRPREAALLGLHRARDRQERPGGCAREPRQEEEAREPAVPRARRGLCLRRGQRQHQQQYCEWHQ